MLKIGHKITLSIFLSCTVVALLLGGLNFFNAQRLIIRDAENYLMSVLDYEAKMIEADLNHIQHMVYAQKTVIENTFNKEMALESPDYLESYKSQLSLIFMDFIEDFNVMSSWMLFNSHEVPGVHTVSFTREEGVFMREPEYDVVAENLENEPWWQNAIIQGEYWTLPYFWEPWDAEIISFSVPVFYDEFLIGVTGSEFFLDPYKKRLNDIRIYETGSIAIIDQEGNPIYIRDDFFYPNLNVLFKDQAFLNSGQGQGLMITEEKEFLAWRYLNNGWIILAIPVKEEMFENLGRIQNFTLMTLLFSFFIALSLGLLVSRTISKPLNQLTHLAENILSHESDLGFGKVKSSSREVQTLTSAFKVMQQDIAQMVKEIQMSEKNYRELAEEKSRELDQTMQSLIQSEKLAALGRLVSGMSHEINTPLGNAVTLASYLEQQNEKILKLLESECISKESILENTQNLVQTQKNLELNILRIVSLVESFKGLNVADKVEKIYPVEVYKIFHLIQSNFNHSCQRKNCELHVFADKDLLIQTHANELVAVLMELVKNAIDHNASEDNRLLKIVLEAREEGNQVIIEVSDNGRGIPREIQPKIFEPFFTTLRNKGGNGLGLSIAYNTVKVHLKGELKCESSESKGTVFTLKLKNRKDTPKDSSF